MDGKEYLKLNQKKARTYQDLVKNGYAGKIITNPDVVDSLDIIQIDNRNVFSGYYDILNISPDGKNLFFLTTRRNASPKKDPAYICIYNLETKLISRVGKTHAWCFQQGSRLRWIDNDILVYNDFIDGMYVTKSLNIKTLKSKIIFNEPFYDMSLKTNIGLSLNFDRLQCLRPGYGYSNRVDINNGKYIPEDDGVFITNLLTKERKLLISYSDLAKSAKYKENDYHYINHISISPNGDKFMFFHLWTKDSLDMWKMQIIVSDLYGKYKIIENEDLLSHYTWLNNDELLVTKIVDRKPCYVIYNLKDDTKKTLANEKLVNDGHPTKINERNDFISDTYPLDNCTQRLFIANEDRYEEILRAFSDPRLYIEKRCDMHPRVDIKHNIVNIDSTYSDGLRKIIVVKLKEEIL